MVGLILDNIVVFLFRLIRVFIGDILSSKWPTVRGVVTGACANKGMYPSTDITYEYKVDGTLYDGRYTRGFWYDSSAEEFADQFPEGLWVVVRYNPARPQRSFLDGPSVAIT